MKGNKKMSKHKRIISFSIIVTLLLVLIAPTIKVNANSVNQGVYEFPVTPENKEWKDFSTKAEMLEVCQIPEEILHNISTSDLVETVLNYPFINDFYYFNSKELAYKRIYEDFNGMRELLSRADATEAILEKYNETKILSADEANNASSKDFFKPTSLEFMLICDKIHNGFTDEEASTALEEANKKEAERREVGIYSSLSDVYLTYITPAPISDNIEYAPEPEIDEEDEDLDKILSEELEDEVTDEPETVAGENWTPISNVKTPKGTLVNEVYRRSPDYSNKERTEIHEMTKNDYPKASRVGVATINYNCHSYAWYNPSPSNKYWFNDAPNEYIDDGSYVSVSGKLQRGYKAYYGSGEHSGIVSRVFKRKGEEIIKIKSKWGPTGLYVHESDYGPYSSSIEYYKRA